MKNDERSNVPRSVLVEIACAIITPDAVLVRPGFPIADYPVLFGLPVRIREPMPAVSPPLTARAPRRRRHGQARRFFWER